MILADTSIWIDHFRYENGMMTELLSEGSIMGHPFVVGELSLGSLANRGQTLAQYNRLPQVRLANMDEVQEMIEAHSLHSQGIGLVDAYLLASVLIDQPVLLWTADKRLKKIATDFGVHAEFPDKSIH